MNTTNKHPQITGDGQSYLDGVIYKKITGCYTVHTPECVYDCTQVINPRQLPVEGLTVGDRVRLMVRPDGSAAIVNMLPRQNKFSRRAAGASQGKHTGEQVIAANVDQIVTVFSAANPAPRWNLLDRYLVTAEHAGIPTLICITKCDLITHDETAAFTEIIADYRSIGYPVVQVSAHSGEGLAELGEALQDRTSVLLGKSGVGKTSLLNALQPGLGLRVNAISQANGKGKHTTTHLEMFPLTAGSAVIDTPGVREFGLWDVDLDDLPMGFPEFRPFLGRCKFRLDCQHDDEPGCAVRKAVMNGQISPRRYHSYTCLREGL